jgi:hypothetical protein
VFADRGQARAGHEPAALDFGQEMIGDLAVDRTTVSKGVTLEQKLHRIEV